jgi:hypothetical protein
MSPTCFSWITSDPRGFWGLLEEAIGAVRPYKAMDKNVENSGDGRTERTTAFMGLKYQPESTNTMHTPV